MGFQYKQISIEERCEIARLRAAGSSLRQIAANLDRARLKAVFSKEVNIVIVGQDQIGVEPLVPHALLCAKKTTLVKQCVHPPSTLPKRFHMVCPRFCVTY